MNQLERDLTDLLAAKADATTITSPPLDAIVAEGRAATARRNRTIGLVAAAAVAAVVAAIAIPVGILHADRSAPVGPSHHPSSPSAPRTSGAQRIMDAARIPYATAVAANGEIASLWADCGGGGCTYAWSLASSSGSHGWSGVIPTDPGDGDSGEQLVDTGAGFIVASYSGSWPGTNFVLNGDGSTTPLRRGHSLTPDPTDPMLQAYPVFHDGGSLWLASAKLDTWQPYLPSRQKGEFGAAGAFAESLWVPRTLDREPELRWQTLPDVWHTHALLTKSPYIAPGFNDVYAGDVAVARGGLIAADSELGVNDRDLLVGLSVSHDAGKTWTDIPAAALPFQDDGASSGSPPPHDKSVVDVFDMAASVNGTLFVDTWNGHLFRSTDDTWTHFTQVRGVVGAADLQPLGNDSVVVTEEAPGSLTLVRFTSDGSSTPLAQFSHGHELPVTSASSTLPPDGPPTIPYVVATKKPYDENGVLYVHGQPVVPKVSGAIAGGSTVLVVQDVLKPYSTTHPDGFSAIHVALVVDRHETPLPALTTTGDQNHYFAISPVLAPGGSYAAAEQRVGDHSTRVREWSFAKRRVVGTVVVPKSSDSVTIDGVTDDGRVYLGVWDGHHWAVKLWVPGQEPRPLTGAAANAADSGRLIISSSGPEEVPGSGDIDAFTADGTEIASLYQRKQSAEVIQVATGRHLPFQTNGAVARISGFESDASIILETARHRAHGGWIPGRILRCSTTTGICAQAMTAPASGELNFARLSWAL